MNTSLIYRAISICVLGHESFSKLQAKYKHIHFLNCNVTSAFSAADKHVADFWLV